MKLQNMLFLYFLTGSLCLVQAKENVQLKGQIIDAKNHKPVADALIVIDGTRDLIRSDDQGFFEMNLSETEEIVLQVHRLGYKTTFRTIPLQTHAGVQIFIELIPEPLPVEEILVTAGAEYMIPQSDILESQIAGKSPKDVGEFFKSVPGAGAIKKGGFAMDPVLRSFKADQLNVQYDGGVHVEGGCPGRMDPPTSHIASEDLEKIEVIKGPFTMRFGQVMGGIVNLVMKKPKTGGNFRIHGAMETGWESNGNSKKGRLSLNGNARQWDFYVSGGSKEYGNYQNGAGKEVPSSFRLNDYSAKVGWQPASNHRLQLSWRESFAREVLYPGLAMDADQDDTDILAIDYAAGNVSSKISSLNFKAYKSAVFHVMSNTRRPNVKMMHSVTTTETEINGGRIEAGLIPARKSLWYIGADFYRMQKDGTRDRTVFINAMTGMPFDTPKQFEDLVWQNTEITDAGVFTEFRHSLSDRVIVMAGARTDFIASEINNPSEQFLQEYGKITEFSEINTNAMVSVFYRMNSHSSLNFSFGRGMRTASITERYINHLTIGMDPFEYFGNPRLKPEVNHQFEITYSGQLKSATISSSVFYSRLHDYISARVDPELKRLYMPSMDPNAPLYLRYAKRFYNVNQAQQWGFDISSSAELGLLGSGWRHLHLQGSLNYTISENLDLNEPLPEIPPLEAKLALHYSHPTENFWGEINSRLVSRQSRITTSMGEIETPGFAVFNLFAGIKLWQFVNLSLAVNNLLDKTYTEHLNRRYNNMPENDILYEPGRNFVLQLRIAY